MKRRNRAANVSNAYDRAAYEPNKESTEESDTSDNVFGDYDFNDFSTIDLDFDADKECELMQKWFANGVLEELEPPTKIRHKGNTLDDLKQVWTLRTDRLEQNVTLMFKRAFKEVVNIRKENAVFQTQVQRVLAEVAIATSEVSATETLDGNGEEDHSEFEADDVAESESIQTLNSDDEKDHSEFEADDVAQSESIQTLNSDDEEDHSEFEADNVAQSESIQTFNSDDEEDHSEFEPDDVAESESIQTLNSDDEGDHSKIVADDVTENEYIQTFNGDEEEDHSEFVADDVAGNESTQTFSGDDEIDQSESIAKVVPKSKSTVIKSTVIKSPSPTIKTNQKRKYNANRKLHSELARQDDTRMETFIEEIIGFPFNQFEEFLKYETYLIENAEARQSLIDYLSQLHCSKKEKYTFQCWRTVLTDDAAIRMTWMGTDTKESVRGMCVTSVLKTVFNQRFNDEEMFVKNTKKFFLNANERIKQAVQRRLRDAEMYN